MSTDERDSRWAWLEIDGSQTLPRRPVPPITDNERHALRMYLDALDEADHAVELRRHTSLPVAWDRLKEMVVESHKSHHFERRTHDEVLYRTVVSAHGLGPYLGGGIIVCRTHLMELRPFRFDGKMIKVRAVGVRERLDEFDPMRCRMCETHVAHGNRCYRDDCSSPLHPQWPAVYCSNTCAMRDA